MSTLSPKLMATNLFTWSFIFPFLYFGYFQLCFWAADPKGTMSCRTQWRISVRPSFCLSGMVLTQASQSLT